MSITVFGDYQNPSSVIGGAPIKSEPEALFIERQLQYALEAITDKIVQRIRLNGTIARRSVVKLATRLSIRIEGIRPIEDVLRPMGQGTRWNLNVRVATVRILTGTHCR